MTGAVNRDFWILWQAQRSPFVQISWQAQRSVTLDGQISWQAYSTL